MAKNIYNYNGIKLPALPELDKTTYPYAVIVESVSEDNAWKYALIVYNRPFVVKTNEHTGLIDTTGEYGYIGDGYKYEYIADGFNWGEPDIAALSNSSAGCYSISSAAPVWSNYEVINMDDNTIYLSASDPVPVTTTPISATTYIKKGGKLYKANGGSAQNILTFDSVDEMNAFNAPDGTIALVPSEGESGAELNTLLENGGIGYLTYGFAQIQFPENTDGRATVDGSVLESEGIFVHSNDLYIGKDATVTLVEVESKPDSDVTHIFYATNITTELIQDGFWILKGSVFTYDDKLLAVSFDSNIASLLGVPAGTYLWQQEVADVNCYIGRMEGNLNEVIHSIDQKYIPTMDYIILNGADEKQYKLTVDESGALAVSEVT